jgi:hypothetical protein
MNHSHEMTGNEASRRVRRTGNLLGWLRWAGVGLATLSGAALVLLLFADAIPHSLRRYLHNAIPRRVDHLKKYQNVVDCSLTGLDLRGHADLIPMLRFNRNTRWPSAQQMPPNMEPGQLLTNAMNPGLGCANCIARASPAKG